MCRKRDEDLKNFYDSIKKRAEYVGKSVVEDNEERKKFAVDRLKA